MNSVKLQDTKSIYKNQLACLYTNNSDEEAFIKQFLAEAAKEDSK